ncbi:MULTISPECIES: aspartate aminotransferase family protein [unclassified Sphingomonas]|uniref:aspartate aminotransferase family protein n=1 Tax=Sphingomonas TaxID=13687 RepID=UPI000963C41F|nr:MULTISPECIES: aspartate aminotransferase family protein [unclassified Sphingomonas]MBN8811407.1 aspartate aminotransferase family protein [Sphingomonas sp.]OJY49680.1 MAG: acetylornithine transaminase [Sphingomonas sp. 67-41]
MSEALMGVYNRAPLEVERGNGMWLHTRDGRAFLDCVAGIATNCLGHAHPRLVAALEEQARKLWHVSNIFRIPGQEELAARLVGATFADAVFFGNSGSEAVECALKAARRYHAVNGAPERIDIVGFAGSFHGRTYAAVNASGNPAYLDGFGPRLPGYVQLTIDDRAAIDEAVRRPTTAAVIVEPVQGEGGARALDGEWLSWLRRLCDAHGVLLIHDEVQSGMGRTGRLFAHQWFDGAEPDIMAVAKALGGGFPIGACLATAAVAGAMTVGAHGSTFGGNPLAMAVGIAAFDEIAREETLANVRAASDRLTTGLRDLVARFPDVAIDVRGKGLLIGIRMVPNNREIMALARDHALLVAGGGENCIRLLPPLTITLDEADEVLRRIEATFAAARVRFAAAA